MLIAHAFSLAGGSATEAVHVSTKAVYKTNTGAASHTFARAMTRASGANRFLELTISTEGNPAPTISSVTYNGVSMVFVAGVTDDEATDNRVEKWALRGASLPGDTSNHDIVVTPSASVGLVAWAVEYDGIGSVTPEWTDTSVADPTPNQLSGISSAGALVTDGVCANAGSPNFTPGAGQTLRGDADNTNWSLGVSDKVGVAAGTVTMDQTVGTSGERIAYLAVSYPKAA